MAKSCSASMDFYLQALFLLLQQANCNNFHSAYDTTFIWIANPNNMHDVNLCTAFCQFVMGLHYVEDKI